MDSEADPAPDAGTPGDRAAGDRVGGVAGRRRPVVALVGVAASVVLADVISKIIVVAQLTPGESVRVLGGAVYFSLIRNSGAAFGLAGGLTVVFALVSAAVVVAIIRVAARLRSALWAAGLGLLLGGALGNLVDRVFRAPGILRGHVVDFISVFGPDAAHFPAFNVADSAITTGAVTIGLAAFLGVGLDGSRTGRGPATAGRTGADTPT